MSDREQSKDLRDTLKPMWTAYIGLGANLPSRFGPPPVTLAEALIGLESLGKIVARSSLYETAPVGFADQPRFVNAVVVLRTGLPPRILLNNLLSIEREFGRDRSLAIPNGPRTLDLDILLVDDLAISEPGLDLPHPRLAERAFALVPLCEIAPHLPIPGNEKTVANLLQTLRNREKGETDAVVRIENDRWRDALQS
jgi:2-amino-4-hydroxy-6-hydroxymethyldihydropteridine diphosphokinase